MFPKLLFITLVAGGTAAALLVARHQRLETVHEMSRTYQQMLQHEQTLWHLRTEIAHRCRPEEVRRMMDELPGTWTTITLPPEIETLPPISAHVVAVSPEQADG